MSLTISTQQVSLIIKVGLASLVSLVGLLPFTAHAVEIVEGAGSDKRSAEVLQISTKQQTTLALTFEFPKPLQQTYGAQWPARIATPAEHVQAFSLPVDVMVEELYAANGQTVEQGQKIARLDSRQLRLWANELLVVDEKRKQCQRELDLLTQRLDLGLSKQNEVVQKHSDCLILSRGLDSAVASLRHAGWGTKRIQQLREGGSLEEYLETTAAVRGIIAEMNITPGQHLEAGITLYELWPQSQLRVQANLPDSLAAQLVVNANALVSPRTNGESFVATVERVSDQVDSFNRRNVWLNTSGNKVNSGAAYYVRFSPQSEQKEEYSTWSVPTAAVVRESGRDWVFVRIPGSGSIKVQPVRVLGVVEGKLQIAADLDATSAIAVTATAVLKGIWLGMGGE